MTADRNQYPFHADRTRYSADHAARMAAAVARGEARRARARRNERLARLAVFACVAFAMLAIFYGVTR